MDSPPSGCALVPLLLLLAVPIPSSCCSFAFNPVSSTFSAHLNKLGPWEPPERPWAVFGDPPDSSHRPPGCSSTTPWPCPATWSRGCSDLWGLHFGALALQRMLGVAGKDLAPLLRSLLAQLHFVADCHIQDPQGCVRLEMVNVSQLLETLAQHLGGLQGRPLHFPGCVRLRCHPALTGTPDTGARRDLSG
ncbi:fms-related tyrosine kinase 3 ligand isoform 1-T2 [Acridotheres tristis]